MELTAGWLSEALGAEVEDFSAERIGTGQMSECHRVLSAYADGAEGPASVVLKVPSSDELSRQTGVALGLYEREVRFYADVAPMIGGPLAPCFHASFDPAAGTFALLLGDAGPADQGDEIAGCDPERARLAVVELARLHAPALGSASLADAEWLNRESPLSGPLIAQLLDGFLERYEARIAPAHREVCERLVASFDAYAAANEQQPQGLVHGDYRLDNLLFGREGADRPLTVVDWQTVGWGPALTDLSYFLGCALTVEDRRAHGEALVAAYHEALGPDAPLTLEQCRAGVRRQSFFGVIMAIVSPMLVERTERGDDMFMTVLARHCEQVLDTRALDVLPAPETTGPLAVDPADEGRHPATGEPLWNESWYFDVADPQQGVGAYVRLGLTPNAAAGSWYTALICGPARPTVAVIDFAVAEPDGDDLAVATDAYEAAQRCEAPLERYRVTLRGQGEAHDDPAGLLRGGRGRPVAVDVDLVWRTAGAPYAYRLATRYEIPCAVSGTLTVDAETFALDGAPGQRDHSWGTRDWWSMGWVWSAGHLDDGTHFHGLDLRIPGTPPIGLGYVQRPGEPVRELNAARASEHIGADGLPTSTTLTLGDLVVECEPLGHGPLRLEADDGRVALFPRAWCRLRAADGREGVGWVEWNEGSPP
ncbi:MAG TPA: phosphotransferase [Solirubrobacteraceae bacterium]|jgi:hypothetical protein